MEQVSLGLLEKVPSVFALVRIVYQDLNTGQQAHKSTEPSTGSIVHQAANPIPWVRNVITVISRHHRVFFGQRGT